MRDYLSANAAQRITQSISILLDAFNLAIRMEKIGRNDPCWCGSEKKYKHCHLNRSQEERRPFGALAHELFKQIKLSTCLHPNASQHSCGKIISAHTLQRSRVLKAITNKNQKVKTFYPPSYEEDGDLKLHEKGWNEASTFSAFCKVHDDSTFAALEKSDYSSTLKEQFLIAYRAACLEFYRKKTVLQARDMLRDNLDRGTDTPTQITIQRKLSAQNAGFNKGLEGFGFAKREMDQALLSGDFSGYSSLEILLSGSTSVVATASVSPNRLLDGTQIQILHDLSERLVSVPFGMDVSSLGTHFIFLWRKSESTALRFIEDINRLSNEDLAEFLVQFIFAFCENTYFSENWWSNLNERQQQFVRKLTMNSNAYYFPPQYDFKMGLSPWKVIGRTFQNVAAQLVNGLFSRPYWQYVLYWNVHEVIPLL